MIDTAGFWRENRTLARKSLLGTNLRHAAEFSTRQSRRLMEFRAVGGALKNKSAVVATCLHWQILQIFLYSYPLRNWHPNLFFLWNG
jgi:hypothetical protein